MTPHVPKHPVIALFLGKTRATLRANLIIFDETFQDEKPFPTGTVIDTLLLGKKGLSASDAPEYFECKFEDNSVPSEEALAKACFEARKWLYENARPPFMAIGATLYVQIDLRTAQSTIFSPAEMEDAA